MVAVAYPLVAEAVFDAADAAFGADVVVTLGPPDVDLTYGFTYLMVGFDAAADSEGVSATFTQEWATVTGPSRDETGTINFSIYHLGGDDALSAMQAVFGVAETLAALVSATGIGEPVTLQWTNALEGATFEQAATDQGSEAMLRFGIGYKARI